MDSDSHSLLNVPITDAERRSRHSPTRSDDSYSPRLSNTPAQHERDRQFLPQIGRFSSLRHPGERYDDPDQPDLYSAQTRGRSSLPGVDEEPDFSDHDDEEPIIRPNRVTALQGRHDAQYASIPKPLSQSEPAHPNSHQPKLWQPLWVTKVSLILTTFLLVFLIASLIAVCMKASSADGFRIGSSAQHYAWTYVPTFIALLVVALFKRIDFWTRTLMPWKALALGPESPEDTVLVDYVSASQIPALTAAFKRLHIPVLASITASVLSLAVAIASTGLFFAQSKVLTDTFPTAAAYKFDMSALDVSILTTEPFPNTAVYTFVQNTVNGLGPQVGIDTQFAYLAPELRSKARPVPRRAIYTATMDTFIPLINCRPANVTVAGDIIIETVDFPYNSTNRPYGSPADLRLTVNEAEICDSWSDITFRGLDPLHYRVPDQTLESRSQEIRCERDSIVDTIVLLTMVEIEYSQTILTNTTRQEGGDLPIALNTKRSVSRMVNVLCQADYTISQVNVTNNTALNGVAAITLNEISSARNRTLQDLTPANMTTIYNSMLKSNAGLFVDTSDSDFVRTPAFDLLSWTAGSGKYDDLFNETILINAATELYLGAMPAFAAQNFVVHESLSTVDGPAASISYAEERLFANWTPVILAIVGLGVMALLTLSLYVILPQDVVPRDPNSIAAQASFLSRSMELNRLLKALQSPQNKGIAAALNGYEVGTAIAVDQGSGVKSFKIHITEGKPRRDIPEVLPEIKYWNPLWVSLPVVALTFLAPLILLALLEVFQNKSDTNRGLWTVPDDRGTLIASHFVPAFVTMLIAAVVHNLDFYVALFSPWSALFKTNVTADRSILHNIIGHSGLRAVVVASKMFQWGALAAALATVFASLLTVFASGLYVVEDALMAGPTKAITRLDSFNLSLLSDYSVDNDNGAGAMFNLIQRNYSFPDGTFQENAYPRISLPSRNNSATQESWPVVNMQGTLPALRGNITCEEPTSLKVESSTDSMLRVSVSYDLPETCLRGIVSENISTLIFSTDFTPTSFGARMFDLRLGANSSEFGHIGEGNSSSVGDNPSVGCPSLAFVWGKFAHTDSGVGNAQVAICYQKIQELNSTVMFQSETTSFAPQSGYMTQESNATTIRNSKGDTDIFDFRIQQNLERQLSDFVSKDPNIDAFFQSLISGSVSVDTAKFLNDRYMAIMLISHTYRIYMAQVINAMLREPITNTTILQKRQTTDLPLLRTTVLATRLFQDRPSKIVLQVLLALSSVLILIGYLLTKIRDVLPCNPCSIAGTMSLLAGSDMVYVPDDGICECCGKLRGSFRNRMGRPQHETIHADENEHAMERTQLIKDGAEWMDKHAFNKLFHGKAFSLGWWEPDSKQGKNKRYGVDYNIHASVSTEGQWYLGKRKNSETFDMFPNTIQAPGTARGRTRELSDKNDRGSYQRAFDASPGVEAHELRDMTAPRSSGREGKYNTD